MFGRLRLGRWHDGQKVFAESFVDTEVGVPRRDVERGCRL
jgi:hypothetical protein